MAKEAKCKKTCKIGLCRRCGSQHNILLCPKDLTESEVRAFLANDEKEDDDDDEEYRDALRDENVLISSLGASIKKESVKETNNTKGDNEQKDDAIDQECDESENSRESEKTSDEQENEDFRDQENAELAFLQCMQARPMIDDEAETPIDDKEEQTSTEEDNIFLLRPTE